MKISLDGLDFLTKEEGLRLDAYQDSAGVWTIGYGHTGDVSPGDTISEERAWQLLQEDVAWAENEASQLLPFIELKQHQFDALVSLIYNIGRGGFRLSTLRRLLRSGTQDHSPLRRAWLAWRYAGGKPILLNRRKREWAVYSEGHDAPGAQW